jgi:hypothetical protein
VKHGMVEHGRVEHGRVKHGMVVHAQCSILDASGKPVRALASSS